MERWGPARFWGTERFFLRCSFFCVAVFFVLQFFCVAVGSGHAHMTPWLITHNLVVVLSSSIFGQILVLQRARHAASMA